MTIVAAFRLNVVRTCSRKAWGIPLSASLFEQHPRDWFDETKTPEVQRACGICQGKKIENR